MLLMETDRLLVERLRCVTVHARARRSIGTRAWPVVIYHEGLLRTSMSCCSMTIVGVKDV